MYAELQAGLSALKAALDLAQAGKGVIDRAAMASALYEVQSRLLETQNAALKAIEENAQLSQRLRALELAASEAQDWKAEASRYVRTTVADGISAYTEVERAEGLRNAVKLCTRCFEDRVKSILQLQHAPVRQLALECPRCKTTLIFRQFVDAQ